MTKSNEKVHAILKRAEADVLAQQQRASIKRTFGGALVVHPDQLAIGPKVGQRALQELKRFIALKKSAPSDS